MKMNLLKTGVLSLLFATASLSMAADKAKSKEAGAKPAYEAGSYDIDPMHSKVGFEVRHLGISKVEGNFKAFEGKVELDKDFSKSQVEAKVKIDSVDTGVAKRDGHLKGEDFFEAAKFPEMTFKSTSIEGKPEAFDLKGKLTIKGETKPVTFKAKYLGTAKDGYGNQKVGFEASTEINRKEFGLKWDNVVEGVNVVGDKVTIKLDLQAGHPAAKKEEKK